MKDKLALEIQALKDIAAFHAAGRALIESSPLYLFYNSESKRRPHLLVRPGELLNDWNPYTGPVPAYDSPYKYYISLDPGDLESLFEYMHSNVHLGKEYKTYRCKHYIQVISTLRMPESTKEWFKCQ
jgi:hypothetical protein